MKIPVWISLPSLLIVRLTWGDRHMSLCAKAQEAAHLRGDKTSPVIRLLNRIFWFDPNHCRDSYIHFRLHRRNDNKEKPT